MTDQEWLDKIKVLAEDIAYTADGLKSHYEIYGADGTYLGGQMHLLSAYKDLRKFIVDNSHEAYRDDL
jgi:hypothetical protein